MSTKKCPFCGEEIKQEAKKCRFCGEWIDKKAASEVSIQNIQSVAESRKPTFESCFEKYSKQKLILQEAEEKLANELNSIKDDVHGELYAFESVSNKKDADYVDDDEIDFFKSMKMKELVDLKKDEELIFLRDTSLLNNWSSGLVITDQAIHVIDNNSVIPWSKIVQVVQNGDNFVFVSDSGDNQIIPKSYFCKNLDTYHCGKILEALNDTLNWFEDIPKFEKEVAVQQSKLKTLEDEIQSLYPVEFKEKTKTIVETVSEREVIKSLEDYIVAENLAVRYTPYLSGASCDTKISVSTFIDDNPDSPYTEMLSDFIQYEQIAEGILEITAKASEKCKVIQDTISEISSNLMEIGLDNLGGKNKKVGGYMIAAAVAAEASSFVYGLWSDYKNSKREEERLRLLLKFKQEIAKEKYVHVARTLIEMTGKMGKYQQLYLTEFSKRIPWNNNAEKYAQMFNRCFNIYLKMEYLRRILVFVVSEMRAWKMGLNESEALLPDLERIMEEEITNWPKRLMHKNETSVEEWHDYLKNIIEKGDDNGLPAPVYLLLSSPYLLRNYLGIYSDEFFRVQIDFSLLYKMDYTLTECFKRQFIMEKLKNSPNKKDNELLPANLPQSIAPAVKDILEKNEYYNEFKTFWEENQFKFSGVGCLTTILVLWAFFIYALMTDEEPSFDLTNLIISLITFLIFVGPFAAALWWWRKRKYQNELDKWIYNIASKDRELAKKHNMF